jgi:glycosyltransferase involved in cell wall biosynthesis
MPDVLGTADVLLTLLEADAGAFSVPSKILSYLCAGRPQVGLIPPANRAARVIRESGGGFVVNPDNPAEFIETIEGLFDDPDRRALIGAKARSYAEREFDVARVAETFEHMITAPLRR